jgi:hypothetical protein
VLPVLNEWVEVKVVVVIEPESLTDSKQIQIQVELHLGVKLAELWHKMTSKDDIGHGNYKCTVEAVRAGVGFH